jgi:CPA1 family monovalent cation:H+ antiporter
VAYIPAQRAGASGVLAAVAAGLYASRQSASVLSPASRLQLLGFWEVLTFLLESLLFLLIGLQLRRIVSGLHGGVGTPLLYGGAVIAGLVAIRMAWMFVVPALVRMARLHHRGEPREAPSELVILGWSGMRGGVSLAAALALPFSAHGHVFNDRGTLVFVAYVAIAATLVVPGLTLSPLARRLGVAESEAANRAEAKARIKLARAALAHIDTVAQDGELEDRILEQLRSTYELRIHRLAPQLDADNADGDEAAQARDARRIRRELIAVERRRLAELRHEGEISLGSERRIQHDLDLEESRLAG